MYSDIICSKVKIILYDPLILINIFANLIMRYPTCLGELGEFFGESLTTSKILEFKMLRHNFQRFFGLTAQHT